MHGTVTIVCLAFNGKQNHCFFVGKSSSPSSNLKTERLSKQYVKMSSKSMVKFEWKQRKTICMFCQGFCAHWYLPYFDCVNQNKQLICGVFKYYFLDSVWQYFRRKYFFEGLQLEYVECTSACAITSNSVLFL